MTDPAEKAPSAARRAALAESLSAVQERIQAAAALAGRAADEVTLCVVTKTFPVTDVAALVALGVADVGESRHQEAFAKHAVIGEAVRWHFIGSIQSKKAAQIAAYADVVHSVDRPELVPLLEKGATRAGRSVSCCVQISLDGDPRRGGVQADHALGLAQSIESCAHLRLAGVMAVPPLGVAPAEAFRDLVDLAQRIQHEFPHATMVSAGMSQDFDVAIQHGANLVRVGSTILGSRPTVGYREI